ncbi:DUF2244 domain-containing protein [Ostreiculturibacter nitratireducens]|uniref:DUF2244 domain-containing protein n=1 Tax=Ostreiculturibacter nitratireducens TaxID=3075226 RepID=UPI0031B612F4
MPYEWVTKPDGAPEKSGASSLAPDAPLAELHLWPYRSLSRRGFVWFVGGTAALLLLPLIGVLGTKILWGLLPFLVATVAGIWWALSRSYRSGESLEELRIWHDRAELLRHDPGRPVRRWEANPYWISVQLHPTGGPVPNYLTLRGGPREVEIGSFLTEEERVELRGELMSALNAVRRIN